MRAKPVVQYPDTGLRARNADVNNFGTQELHTLIEVMVATMHKENGIGLAAPQIAVPLRIAVIAMKDGPLVMANPTISGMSKKGEIDEEGCLSVKGVFGLVDRAYSLHLHAYDAEGVPYETDAKGLFARVIQHEFDHLEGKLFIDRCSNLTAGVSIAKKLGLTIPPIK